MKLAVCFLVLSVQIFDVSLSEEILGCGGFIKSHVPIDFAKVVIKLITKNGAIKDETNCAPKTGYYFIPIYDKGEFILQLEPPPGWSFTTNKIPITIDGKTDPCSLGKDINFAFKGFGITGKVESLGSDDGPADVDVKLSTSSGEVVGTTVTGSNGNFFFTPVYPGNYILTASHASWQFLKSTLSVTVTEGNTELPSKSLIIKGYDVNGFVKSDGEPLNNVLVLLFAKGKTEKAENCETTPLKNYKELKPLCYVSSNSLGAFRFPLVANGNYEIKPFYDGKQINFQPDAMQFNVNHGSVHLDRSFDITGFSISGLVKSSSKSIGGAKIALNGKEVAVTKGDGSYTLENIQAGNYELAVDSPDHKFQSKTLKLSPTISEIPILSPSAYKVCGRVVSDKEEKFDVSITKVGSTQHFVVQTDPQTGRFCEFLSSGSFNIEVNVQDKGLQFYPITQTVKVTDSPIFNVEFSQLKVTMSGKVKCKSADDCRHLKVIIRPVEKGEELIVNVKGDQYSVSDIRPGTYRITLSSNKLCWNEDEFVVSVSHATFTVPPFVSTGYSITFISSHETKLTYAVGQMNVPILVKQGTSQHCVLNPGAYTFKLESCHTYESPVIQYNTNQAINEIVISAIKHRATVNFDAKENLGDISVIVNAAGDRSVHMLAYQNKQYTLSLMLAPGQTATISPKSEFIFYNPSTVSVTGKDDCVDFGTLFSAKRGKVFAGRVNPPLKGVRIAIENPSIKTLTFETDANGYYNFPPLDDSKTYEISASKESYVFVGPDKEGNFVAQKLAEIIVEVIDESTGIPLHGALLSLSGPNSYRKNLKTNEDGKITFSGLSPSEYFLKPMLKEYSFHPPSKLVNVLVGSTVNMVLKGKKVAYSAYGMVTSLNNQPEKQMVVLAKGLNNCTEYIEEATTESNGKFRIRGLIPYCSYELTVKTKSGSSDVIERVLPDPMKIESVTADLQNLHLIVFRPAANVDLFVQVYTKKVDVYKSLRVKVVRETSPSAVLQTLKIDSNKVHADNNAGVILQTPTLPMDGKSYSVQLESNYGTGKWSKVQSRTFEANNSYKVVALEFTSKTFIPEQQIKQTSVWTLAFIFLIMVLVYNIDLLVDFLKRNVKIPAGGGSPEKTWEQTAYDKNDIDQIVEIINAPKKKVKSKRV